MKTTIPNLRNITPARDIKEVYVIVLVKCTHILQAYMDHIKSSVGK